MPVWVVGVVDFQGSRVLALEVARPTAESAVRVLTRLFAEYGAPEVLQSTCARQAICSLSVGAGSTITCSASAASCVVDCAGDCQCTGATCNLTCAPGVTPAVCGDGGVRACGACPTDRGVDAGPPPAVDGGTDAGVGEAPRLEPWSLKVGCSSAALAPLSLALLALLRRR